MPSPTTGPPRKRKKRKAQKRAGYWALLRAVPKTVAKLGFRGLTYRAIADEAGVTYGLIGYYFGTREVLIQDAAKLAVDEAIVGSSMVPESGEIEDFSSGLTTLLREDLPGQAFQFDLVTESMRNKKLRPPVMELYTRYIGAVDDALQEFGIEDDPYLARVIFAALDGLILQQFVFEDEEETERSIVRLRDIIAATAATR